jgi:hypothetical protein
LRSPRASCAICGRLGLRVDLFKLRGLRRVCVPSRYDTSPTCFKVVLAMRWTQPRSPRVNGCAPAPALRACIDAWHPRSQTGQQIIWQTARQNSQPVFHRLSLIARTISVRAASSVSDYRSSSTQQALKALVRLLARGAARAHTKVSAADVGDNPTASGGEPALPLEHNTLDENQARGTSHPRCLPQSGVSRK